MGASRPLSQMNKKENRGYSRRLVAANYAADVNNLGVALGRQCIRRDIPVKDIAKDIGVSRQTIYLWFYGLVEPQSECQSRIRAYLASITREFD